MDNAIKRHIEQVKEWLNENVQVFPEPKSVTLFDFTVNWEEFSGWFPPNRESFSL